MPIFTEQFLRNASAKDAQRVDYKDDRVHGLLLRVTPSGIKTFAFRYWSPILQKWRVVTIGRYPTVKYPQARKLAEQHRGTIGDGVDPRQAQIKDRREAQLDDELTFEGLCEKYLTEYACVKKKSWKNDQQYLKQPRGEFGHMQASAVTDDDFADLLTKVAQKSPVTANRTQSVLHKMFQWAKQPGRKYVTSNPLSGLERRGEETPRDRVLSDEEIKILWWGLDREDLNVDRPIRQALKLILATMCRPGQSSGALVQELRNLDGEDPLWFIPSTRVKKKRPVIMPLCPLAVEVIKRSLTGEDQIVLFPSRYNAKAEVERHSLSQALNNRRKVKGIRDILGLEHFTPHDLRRTAATLARRAGSPRDHVKAMLDHLEGDVTAVYDQYDMLPEKRGVAKILGEELNRIIGEKP